MTKKYQSAVMVLISGLLAGCAPAAKLTTTVQPKVKYELGRGAGFYNYAPSAIQDKYGIRYLFLCQNKNPFEIVDYIYLFKGIPTENGYVWQQGTEIVAPSKQGWDKIHICDPDVREFSFKYKGEQYKWIMTYLGVDQWYNHNQVGLAFSKNIEGPYIKYDQNPLVPYSDTTKWGVGQSTSIVIDSNTIQLFYSKSDTVKSKMMVREIRFTDGQILLSEEKIVPHLYPNTYFANSSKYRYAVSEVRINQVKEIPTWVGNHVRFVYKDISSDLFAEKEDWKEIGLVGPAQTRFPRNHNPGFLTDTKGYMLSDDEAIIYFTVAMIGDNWLWSYDVYSATYDLKTYFNNKARE